jgi:hypothetical protein
MQVTQKPTLELAAPIFELGWGIQAVPMGRTVKVSKNSLASGKGAGKNQYAVSMGKECTSSHQFQPYTQLLK